MTTGVVRHACRHRVTARGVFVLGDSFTRPELGNDTEGRGAVAVCSEGLLRGHVLAGGPASHACRRGSGSTRGFNFLFWGFFHTLGSGRHEGVGFCFSLAVAPVSEGDCFTRTGVDGTREVGFCFFFGGCSGVGGGFFHTHNRDSRGGCAKMRASFPLLSRRFPAFRRYKRPCPPTSSQNRPARIRCAAFRNSPPSCAPRLSLNWPPGRSRRFR